jgi:histidine ammonia-lyase
MYIHSIPNNNDNQDIVSMGTNAANVTKTVIDNAFEVISVELITIVQALRYLNFNDKLSNKTRQVLEEMNKIIPEIKEDFPLYKINAEVKKYLRNNEIYK